MAGQVHLPGRFTSLGGAQYLFGGPQDKPGGFAEEKNPLPLPGIETGSIGFRARRLTLALLNTLPRLQKRNLKQRKYDKYMYFNKTSQFQVLHHFTYSAFKAKLNFTAPEACLRFRFRLLLLGKRMCYECRGH